MSKNLDIVKKLWNFAKILKDDGVTYLQYTTELTYLLFLKMNDEIDKKNHFLKKYNWKVLSNKKGVDQFNYYRELLLNLSSSKLDYFRDIFYNASTSIREPRNLNLLISNINKLDWYSVKNQENGLSDLYEGLLEKTGNEGKKGAGQYYTPRSIIELVVDLIKPKPGEIIQDPAIGTGGFIVAADKYIKKKTDDLFNLKVKQQNFQKKNAYKGIELISDSHRLCMMNLYLHGIESSIVRGNTLSSLGKNLTKSDIILTNPPFGSSNKDSLSTRDDFVYETSNKQLSFLQHIYLNLKPEGRAAVVLPDSVLSIEGVGTQIRKDFLDQCILHTILRLPQGIFYTRSVRTNILFFYKKKNEKEQNKKLWIYDYRTSINKFGKTMPLTRDHLKDFEEKYGKDEYGRTTRISGNENERFRSFDFENIIKNKYNLDIRWLKDEEIKYLEKLPPINIILSDIQKNLEKSLEVIKKLNEKS